MAKPRVFISSTFYDLRQIRADLDRFIKELGYEPVLNESGAIPYGNEEKLEEYCYKEIELCDMLIAIIGGRYGTQSENESYSVSQMEIKTALRLGKQVYIFIEKNVLSEYQTYLVNKGNKKTNYRFADNIAIYEFIEEIESLPVNKPIHPFEISGDITFFLKEQWAGLFQRFLQEASRMKEVMALKELETTAKTLNQLVNFLTEERRDKDQAIKDILLSNHPAMERLRSLLNVKYRVYFTDKGELDDWLVARSFNKSGVDEIFDDEKYYSYIRQFKNKRYILEISRTIFTKDEKLKPFSQTEWDPDYIRFQTIDIQATGEDEIPF